MIILYVKLYILVGTYKARLRRFCDAGLFFCFVEELLYRITGDVFLLFLPIKQPLGRMMFSPV